MSTRPRSSASGCVSSPASSGWPSVLSPGCSPDSWPGCGSGSDRGCSGSCSGTFSPVCSSGGCSGFCSCPDWLPPVPVSCVSGAAASVPPSPSPKLSRRTGWIFSFRIGFSGSCRCICSAGSTTGASSAAVSTTPSRTRNQRIVQSFLIEPPSAKQKHPTRRRIRCSQFQPKTAILLTCDLGGFPPACCSYLLTVSRNGCLSARRFRASERPSRAQFFRVGPFLFRRPLPNTPARRSYTSSLCYFFRLYHTAGAGKSLLFFACLFAGNGRLGRTENPPLSCGAWQGRVGGIAYAASLVMFMSTFAPIARVAVPFGLKAPLEPAR